MDAAHKYSYMKRKTIKALKENKRKYLIILGQDTLLKEFVFARHKKWKALIIHIFRVSNAGSRGKVL